MNIILSGEHLEPIDIYEVELNIDHTKNKAYLEVKTDSKGKFIYATAANDATGMAKLQELQKKIQQLITIGNEMRWNKKFTDDLMAAYKAQSTLAVTLSNGSVLKGMIMERPHGETWFIVVTEKSHGDSTKQVQKSFSIQHVNKIEIL